MRTQRGGRKDQLLKFWNAPLARNGGSGAAGGGGHGGRRAVRAVRAGDAYISPARSVPPSASSLSRWPKPRWPVDKPLVSVGQVAIYVIRPTRPIVRNVTVS